VYRVPFSERFTCSIKEAAAATGLGKSTLYELMDEGRIAYTKVNSRRLFSCSHCLSF
jgi:excisionase family DNA binding protein